MRSGRSWLQGHISYRNRHALNALSQCAGRLGWTLDLVLQVSELFTGHSGHISKPSSIARARNI